MIRNSSKISCGGSNGNLCSRSEGSGESAHLHRLAWAFVTVSESCACSIGGVWVIYASSEQRIKALVNIHKAAQVHLSLLSLDNLISTKLSCRPEIRFRCHIWLQRLLWRVCTFAQAQPSHRHCTKILYVGSNNDLCPFYTSSEGSGETAPVNTTTGCNHRCVISMLTSRLWKSSIKLIAYFIKKMSFHGSIILPIDR